MPINKRRTSYPRLDAAPVSPPTRPAAEVARPDMTPGEARVAVQRARQGIESSRSALLDLHDRKGWKALGYRTWTEFVDAEFSVSLRHLNRQIGAARTEREITQVNETGPIGPVLEDVPESVLRPLTGRLAEEKAAVLVRAQATVPRGKVTARVVREVLDPRRPSSASPKASCGPAGPPGGKMYHVERMQAAGMSESDVKETLRDVVLADDNGELWVGQVVERAVGVLRRRFPGLDVLTIERAVKDEAARFLRIGIASERRPVSAGLQGAESGDA